VSDLVMMHTDVQVNVKCNLAQRAGHRLLRADLGIEHKPPQPKHLTNKHEQIKTLNFREKGRRRSIQRLQNQTALQLLTASKKYATILTEKIILIFCLKTLSERVSGNFCHHDGLD